VELLDQRQLEAVGVLELVDHQLRELLAVALADRLGGAQEPDRLELEVLEVERRAVILQRFVAAPEVLDQGPQLGVGRGQTCPATALRASFSVDL